jgi:YfiH family protein
MPLPTCLLHPDLPRIPGIRYGFLTRHVPIQRHHYQPAFRPHHEAIDPDEIRRNRTAAMACFGQPEVPLSIVCQVHGAEVSTLTGPHPLENSPLVDAQVTATRGIALGVLTADCGPVLLADSKAGVIGAAHAGWKGALGGIVENTIQAMEKLGATRQDTILLLGPCIYPESYEVTEEFLAAFLAQSSANSKWFTKGNSPIHWWFDLPGYILAAAKNSGISQRYSMEINTYARQDLCFSFRLSTHQKGPYPGSLLSIIQLDCPK